MLKEVPWSVLVMVCGVSVLIGVLEGTGGMELFTELLARVPAQIRASSRSALRSRIDDATAVAA